MLLKVPGKPRKSDKKQQKVSQKSVKPESNAVSSAQQKSIVKESSEPPSAAPSNVEKNGTLNESVSSDGTVENMLREFTNGEARKHEWLKTEQKPSVNSDIVESDAILLGNSMNSHGRSSNGEKFSRDSQSAICSEAAVESPSTTHLPTPYTSSKFTNLSLSNLLEDEIFEKNVAPAVLSSVLVPNKESQSQRVAAITQNVDTPPGLYTGPALTSDILSGPPPGFEDVHFIDSVPPGLLVPLSSTSSLSKAIARSDIAENTPLETMQKTDDEWYDANEN